MRIRKAVIEDADRLKELFQGTIQAINSRDYTKEQTEAWSSTAENTDSLVRRIREQHFFVMEENNKVIIGFASVDNTGYLDFMYVHKNHQGGGVGRKLLAVIIETARRLKLKRIESGVSITAKPFFERFGFTMLNQQTVQINDVSLTNYKMQLILPGCDL